jgi:3-dehydrotetronate 4-kinase
MLLGAIADDLTGATDLALSLSRGGLRTILLNGLTEHRPSLADADAVVVALKSRTIPPAEAVAQSLAAAAWLKELGTQQFFFKYCSTFDSTDQGNIGPVADALMDFLGVDRAVVCPAFPANGRTVYQGHLFVGRQLLSDSPMKDHPLTPMRDANLVRLLQRQTKRRVSLIDLAVVRQGASEIRRQIDVAEPETLIVIDALVDSDLLEIAAAVCDHTLLTGGSGLAIGVPDNFQRSVHIASARAASAAVAVSGRSVVLAGSCSTATRRQVKTAIAAGVPALKIDPLAIHAGDVTADAVAEWVLAQSAITPLVYSESDPEKVSAAQRALGVERAGHLVERLLGEVASTLRDRGFSQFLVAGGETSGAVVAALNVIAVLIGPEIDPGVPWTFTVDEKPLALALKSGNFGSDDFFIKAWSLIE